MGNKKEYEEKQIIFTKKREKGLTINKSSIDRSYTHKILFLKKGLKQLKMM